jgi:hypothetical protein
MVQQEKANKKVSGGGKTVTDMATYGSIAERIRSGEELTENDIVGLGEGRLSVSDSKGLMKMLSSRDTAAGKFKMSTTLINSTIPASAKNTEKKNAYKGALEQSLQDWKESNPGKIPNYEEQRAIAASASEEYVAVDNFLLFDRTKEAYQLQGGEKNVYPKRYRELLPNLNDDQRIEAYSKYQQFRADKRHAGISESQFLLELAATLEEAKQNTKR